MARSSANRKIRRLVKKAAPTARKGTLSEVAKALPEPNFPKTVNVKVKHVFSLGQSAACVGTDNKVYLWNAYAGGWILNEMSTEEKERLKVQVAINQQQEEKKAGAKATNEAAQDNAPPVHIKSIEREAQDKAAGAKATNEAEDDVMN